MKNIIIIGVTVLFGLLILTVAMQPANDKAPPSQSVESYIEHNGKTGAVLGDEIIEIKDPKTGFVFKFDPRHYSTRPDKSAAEQGWTDERDFMTLVEPRSSTMPPYYIDAFEAVISGGRAWSTIDATPTDRLRYSDAQSACEAAGKRLCTETEWRTACRGGMTSSAQFKDIGQLARHCDVARPRGYKDYVGKTDAHPNCPAPGLAVYNMIGNVAEYVTADTGEAMIVGLAFGDGTPDTIARTLTYACEKTVKAAGTYRPFKYYNARGFRCCRDAN